MIPYQLKTLFYYGCQLWSYRIDIKKKINWRPRTARTPANVDAVNECSIFTSPIHKGILKLNKMHKYTRVNQKLSGLLFLWIILKTQNTKTIYHFST